MNALKIPSFASALAVLLLLGGCGGGSDGRTARAEEKTGGAQMEEAIFAGGCFWCMQAPFEKLKGVSSVVAGYTGGEGKDPTYEDYAEKGHVEAIDVTFDPAQITYSQLLDVFWRQIDPTDAGGQFVDRGPQYRSAIFYHNDEQKRLAEKSKQELAASGKFDKPIVTEILKAAVFYKAEDYHQDYYKKNPIRYKFYRSRSGRDQFLDKVWGKDRNVKRVARERPGIQQAQPGRAQEETDGDPVQGHAAERHRAAVQERVLEQRARRASMWTSFPESRSSPRSTNSIPAPAGRVSRGRWSRATSSSARTTRSSRSAPKSAARTPIRTSATSSTTARRRPACATA